MIDHVAIDDSQPHCTRARVTHATACYYPGSQRIIVMADCVDVDAAQAALIELRTYLGWVSPTSLVPAEALNFPALAAAVAAYKHDATPNTLAGLLDAVDATVATLGHQARSTMAP